MIYYVSREPLECKKDVKIVQGVTHEITSCTVAESLALAEDLPNLICVDTEDTGLSCVEDKIIMLQFGTPEVIIIVDARDYDINIYKHVLESRTCLGVNIAFDYNMLKRYDILLTTVIELMIVQKLIDGGEYDGAYKNSFKQQNGCGFYSMAGLTFRNLAIPLDKETTLTFLHVGDRPFSLTHVRYGAQDIVIPFMLYKVLLPKLNKNTTQELIDLENTDWLALADISYFGMPMCKGDWLNLDADFKAEEQKHLEGLDKEAAGLPRLPWEFKSMFGGVTINWNSSPQLLKLFNKGLGIFPKDKEGKPATGKSIIEKFALKHPIISKLIKYKGIKKQRSTYGIKFLDAHLDIDRRVRTSFDPIVATGRVSSFKPKIRLGIT